MLHVADYEYVSHHDQLVITATGIDLRTKKMTSVEVSPGASTIKDTEICKEVVLKILREDERLALYYLHPPQSNDNACTAWTRVNLSRELFEYIRPVPSLDAHFSIDTLWRRKAPDNPWQAERYAIMGELDGFYIFDGLGKFE